MKRKFDKYSILVILAVLLNSTAAVIDFFKSPSVSSMVYVLVAIVSLTIIPFVFTNIRRTAENGPFVEVGKYYCLVKVLDKEFRYLMKDTENKFIIVDDTYFTTTPEAADERKMYLCQETKYKRILLC